MKQARFRAIAAALRDEIVAGRLRPGERLMTEHQLATEHNVGRGTAREALAELVRQGLIVARRPHGYFVTTREQDDYDHAAVDAMVNWDAPPQIVPAPPAVTERTGWDPSEPVVRRAWVDGSIHRELWWPLHFANGTELLDAHPTHTELDIVAGLLAGEPLQSDDVLTAVTLDRDIARAMAAGPGSPALCVATRWRTSNDRVVRLSVTLALDVHVTRIRSLP